MVNLILIVGSLYVIPTQLFKDGRQMSIRSTVMSQMEQVAEEQQRKLPTLTDDLVLLDSGLDSLGFAILVARLEDEIGFDPFTASNDVYFPVTLGDFIRV